MKKLRILGFICMALAICAVLLFTCTTEASAATVASGTCGSVDDGSDVKWVLDDTGTLTISGSGAMQNRSSTFYVPWKSRRDSIKAVVIQDGVTSIGSYSFGSCSNLTTVTIGNGVVEINASAFEDCTGLTSITIPNSVTTIRGSSFEGCSALKSVIIGNGVTTIEEEAFRDCTGLTTVRFGNSVESIGSYAFYGCTSLTSVTFPDSVKSVSNDAFNGCTGLTSVNMGNGLTSLEYEAFYGCTALKTVTFSKSLTEISGSTFSGCTGLTSVSIPDNITAVGAAAFGNCSSLKSVYIGSGLASIKESAFSYCNSLQEFVVADQNPNYTSDTGLLFNKTKTVLVRVPGGISGSYTIPSGVSIGEGAFYGCTKLSSVIIPKGVTRITTFAFYGCSGLNSIVIPDSVSSIERYAFFLCNKGSIIYCGTEEQWSKVYIWEPNPANTSAPIAYHDLQQVSCTSPKTCTYCGYTEGEAPGHSWTEATCTTAKTCSACSETEGNALGHTGNWMELVPVGCDVDGINARICETCGETETETIPATGHSYGEVVTAPTCTEQGYTTKDCSVCGDHVVTDYVAATGHSYTETVTQPTCTEAGSKVSTCSVCGDQVTETIPAKGHGWSAWVTTVKATCTKEGSQMRFCTCGTKETEVIAKLPHSYVDGVCATCSTAMSGYVVLSADMNLTGLGLTEDLYVDLKGFDLSGTIITNGFKIYGMDSTTDGYTCESVGLFSCVDENGNAIVPVQQFKSNITGSVKRYMAIKAEDGYTFHRIYLAITKVNIRPDQTGFGYKAVFYGDEQVLNQLDSFGFKLQLEGQAKVLTQAMEASKLEMGREYSLLLQNFDVEAFGTTDVHAEVFLKLKDGTQIESSTVSYSMKSVLQKLCESLDVISDTQLQALKTMCLPFKATMSSWNIDALLNDE